MAEKVLITGGTGTVGCKLINFLQDSGYNIVCLTTSHQKADNKKYFFWDPSKNFIPDQAFDGVTSIINLAGAGIADKPWTSKRKREIEESRVKSVITLQKFLSEQPHKVSTFITTSAAGFYGYGNSDKIFNELSLQGDDFLAQVTKNWEEAADKIQQLGIRSVKLRLGIVLSEKGGAFEKFKISIKKGIGAILGTGRQYISWIHIDDVCAMFLFCMENISLQGIYNAVSPLPVTNKEMFHTIAQGLGKKILLPRVPGFLLKLIFGERADILLKGSKVSCKKILKEGFIFKFPEIESAVTDLLKKK